MPTRSSQDNTTGHDHTERILQARIRLMEHALTRSFEEILTATLDEAEELTNSRIGFYHFLQPDQKKLSIQSWSSHTLREECAVSEHHRDPDIRKAGVWTDCIHKAEPVIHNDYPGLSHKKGLPPGHPDIARELVVPVHSGDTVVALLGVGNKPDDYTEADIEAVSLLANLAWDIAERKRAEEDLRSQRQLLEVVIDGIEDVLAILRPDRHVERLNRAGHELFGVTREVIRDWQCFELLGRSRKCQPCSLQRALEKRAPASVEHSFPELETHIRCRCSPVWQGRREIAHFVAQLQDISEQKRHEARLQDERDYLYRVFNAMTQYVVVSSPDLRIEFLNYAARELFGNRTGEKCYEQLQRETACPHCPARLVLGRNEPEPIQYTIEAFDRVLEGNMTKLDNRDGSESLLMVVQDVTDRSLAQQKAHYLTFHDSLTGLYNRAYLEEEMQRLTDERFCPMGIVVCDINGLKLINDTLGHPKGDQLLRDAADILRSCFRSSDIISRIGGDEFAVLLPRSDENTVRACRERIRSAIRGYNEQNSGFGLSIAVGSAIQHSWPVDMNALYKQADDAMYTEKLQQSQSAHNDTVQALIKSLQTRDHLTEGHGGRLDSHARKLGRSLGLSRDRLTNLQLLARFHDLGKVGVPDHILYKPGPLTEEEFQEMKRHSEIGYRIALSLSDLAPVADLILKHHEWWDGRGYPLGLSGEDIPLECRILAIVDAYDTMVHTRPYKEAMSHREAVRELRHWAGTQLDPDLVERFLRIVDS